MLNCATSPLCRCRWQDALHFRSCQGFILGLLLVMATGMWAAESPLKATPVTGNPQLAVISVDGSPSIGWDDDARVPGRQCNPPTGLVRDLLTDTVYEASIVYGPLGGKVRLILGGVMGGQVLAEGNLGPGPADVRITGLTPGTLYNVCFFNFCDEYHQQFSEFVCDEFTTVDDSCPSPTGYALLGVDGSSFLVQITMGEYGGVARLLLGDTVLAQGELASGVRTVSVSQLNPNTLYSMCFENFCDAAHSQRSPALCRDIWTGAQDCLPPADLEVTEITSIGFTAQVTMGAFGGRARLIWPDQTYSDISLPAGPVNLHVSEDSPLTPGTSYRLCVFNACDDSGESFSEGSCVDFTTLSGHCEPPLEYAISEVTSNSALLTVQFGRYGGRAELLADGFLGRYDFDAGQTQKQLRNLPSGTGFGVGFMNFCEDGSLSDAALSSFTTLDSDEDNGLLTAPAFVDESHVGVTENGKLQISLPHPNADGWDRLGMSALRYRVDLVQGCDTLFSQEVAAGQYPYSFTVPYDLPQEDYEVHVRRISGLLNKDGESVSQGTVIVGPPATQGGGEIPSSAQEIQRWLLHVPRIQGGFKGTLVFSNLFPETPAKVWLAGFDVKGNLIDETRVPLLIMGPRAEIPIYPTNAGMEALFSAELIDQVSHLGVYEEGGNHWVTTSLTYQHVSDPDALSATVEEVDLTTGTVIGSSFTVEARKSTAFWDGVAILNLAADHDARVTVVQRDGVTGNERARHEIGSIAAGEKVTAVLSDGFSFCADCYYTVETDQSQNTVELLGLRGSLNLEKPLLVKTQTQKIR